MSDATVERGNIVNVNVGILGHVDSGKTSLVKALSTLLSTAALDKNPQSQERGITLDLGFSAFILPMPSRLKESAGLNKEMLQFTLVDCPGHASLIRTIIGGAQIIDMMILVIDANKGIQTQTAECIVIGEITTDKLIIVLNKCDLLPESERDIRITKMTNKLRKIFATTKFALSPIIATSAALGGEKVASVGLKCALERNLMKKDGIPISMNNTEGVTELVELIRNTIEIPNRNTSGPLYFAVDHCFSIKGHGTVLTGTVLSGSFSVNSTIEIPHLQLQRKVKSMQMFRKNVRTAGQGDRVGMCVTNLDPTSIERSIAVSPGSISLLSTVICLVKKVRFFRQACKSDTKFHISIGHTTVAATVAFYGAEEISILLEKYCTVDNNSTVTTSTSSAAEETEDSSLRLQDSESTSLHAAGANDQYTSVGFDTTDKDSKAADNTSRNRKTSNSDARQSSLNAAYHKGFPALDYPWDTDFEHQDTLKGTDDIRYGNEPVQWAVLQFQRPVFCPIGSLIIGSRLDTFSAAVEKEAKDGHNRETASQAGQCRLAFYGPIKESVSLQDMEKIKVYSWKEKQAQVFKITDSKNGICVELIGCNLVQEGGNVQNFIGMKIETSRGHLGVITGPYGSGGNFKVKFSEGVSVAPGSRLTLRFKRYLHDKMKIMAQQGLDEYSKQRAAAIGALSPFISDDGEEGEEKKKSNRQKKAERKAAENKLNCPVSSVTLNQTLDDTAHSLTMCEVKSNLDVHVSSEGKLKNTSVTADTDITVALAVEPISNMSTIEVEKNKINRRATSMCPSKSPLVIPAASSGITPMCQLRVGVVESCKSDLGSDSVIAIVSGAFRMEEKIRDLAGSQAKVHGHHPITGTLLGPFAKLGKCKVSFPLDSMISIGMSVEITVSTVLL
jgi:small GTP-binding protein